MPKSKVRKKNDFTISPVSRTPVKVKAGPSSTWFVVFFIGLMLIGLVWLLVFQLASSAIPFMADLGPWNYAIAFAFMITGLLLTMRWPEWHNERYEFIFVAARYPISNLAVIGSHGCDSSPLGIALVDNLIGHGKRVLNTCAAN